MEETGRFINQINETDRVILLGLLQKTKQSIPLLTNENLLNKVSGNTL